MHAVSPAHLFCVRQYTHACRSLYGYLMGLSWPRAMPNQAPTLAQHRSFEWICAAVPDFWFLLRACLDAGGLQSIKEVVEHRLLEGLCKEVKLIQDEDDGLVAPAHGNLHSTLAWL